MILEMITTKIVVTDTDKSCVADFIAINVENYNFLDRGTAQNLSLQHIGRMFVNFID